MAVACALAIHAMRWATARTSGEEMELIAINQDIRLGDVHANEKRDVVLELANAASSSRKIFGVRIGCGCLAAVTELPLVLAGGTRAELQFALRAPAKPGPASVPLDVYAEPLARPPLPCVVHFNVVGSEARPALGISP